MTLTRLRLGELAASAGLIGLFVMLLLTWFEPDTSHVAVSGTGVSDTLSVSGWTSLGWLAVILVAAGMVVCAAWLIATLTQPSPALPVALQVWSFVAGVVLSLLIIQRLIFTPDLGYGADADAQLPGVIGLICAMLIAAGAFVSMKDERTGAAESQPGEIELRPVPPPRSQ